MDWALIIQFAGALFAVMNPFINLPIFLSLTNGMPPSEQKRTGVRVAIYSFFLSLIIAFVGGHMLSFFGVTIDDFRVAGGLVLMTIAFNMLKEGGNTAHHGTDREKKRNEDVDNVVFYPLTFPITVGPGTITTLIVFFQSQETVGGYLGCIMVLAAITFFMGVVLYFAAKIGSLLSFSLRMMTTRFMGMILISIAIAMITTGLKALLPGLAG